MPGCEQEPSDQEHMESIARRFHERQLKAPLTSIATLIHEDAEMALVVSDLATLRGRAEILSRLSDVREAMVYSATVERCEGVGPDTLLLCGRARYATDRGVGDSAVFWIDEFRDGLLWRVRAYWSESEARRAYKSGRY